MFNSCGGISCDVKNSLSRTVLTKTFLFKARPFSSLVERGRINLLKIICLGSGETRRSCTSITSSTELYLIVKDENAKQASKCTGASYHPGFEGSASELASKGAGYSK